MTIIATDKMEMRDAFIGTLYAHAKDDKDLIFLSADFGASSLDKYRKELKEQFINVGICEQSMISIAGGLAIGGKSVAVYSIASFATLRCLEQIKLDLCVMKLPVMILGVGPCYAYDIDGPTHHASEDIAILRSLSNMHIYSPSDAENCATAADEIVKIRQPVYCRLDRGKYPILGRTGPNDLKRGFRVFGEGQDVCLIATGSMVHVAIKVAEYLKEQNINARVLDLFRIKPINNNSLASALEGIHHLVTIEEHTIHGGIGSVISEFVTDNRIKTKLKRMAIDDSRLYAYGNRNLLLKKRGLDANSITNDVLSFIEMA